jgi:hypothetical protein
VREIEIRRADAEVDARRRLDAVRASAVVHVVQVETQDVGLRTARLELQRDQRFMRLPDRSPRRVVAQVETTRELLRDRRCARGLTASARDRARDRERVDAPVLPEAPVLGGDRRLAHHRSDGGKGDRDAQAVPAVVLQHRSAGVEHDRAGQRAP